MLGLTFTKNHFSKNSKGEEIQVCEFEIRRFDGHKRYRFTMINRITFLLEKYIIEIIH
ncbi:MAG: hypothetical protein L3J07_04790 [Candidatus Magasanikbacteria bacterium]|nr:hypothetical protein [Candidatus Magasanikbacteria bacterium]